MKKILSKVSILFIILVIFTHYFPLNGLYGPYNLMAQAADSNDHQLYQVIEPIELENGIILEEATFLYGNEVKSKDKIEIQYADTYISIDKDNLIAVKVNNTENELPKYIEFEKAKTEEEKSISDTEYTSLYSLYPDEEERGTFDGKRVDYPVYKNEVGVNVIYLGNVEFYLSKEDRKVIFDKSLKEGTMESNNTEMGEGEKDDSEQNNAENEEIISDQEINKKDSETIDSDNTEGEKAEEDTSEQNNAETEGNDVESEKNISDYEVNKVVEEDIGERKNQSEKLREEENRVIHEKTTFSTINNTWENTSANYFKVVENKLSVYSKGNKKVLGTLEEGQVYPIKTDYGNWHQIQYGSDYGYVYKPSTIPDDGKTLKNENTKYINSNQTFVTLREVPIYDNSTGELVQFGAISEGERYPIVSDYGSDWSRVIFADRVGYVLNSNVRKEFVGEEKYFQVLTNNLPVYDNRSGSLKEVGTLTKGQVYEIVSDYGNWHKIQFNNYYGYVYKANTVPSSGDYINNKNISYEHSNSTFTTKQEVVIYDNSSGHLKPFGTIKKGQTYHIASDYGNWLRIIFADRIGYVYKDYVELNFDESISYFKVQVDNLPVYDNSGGSLVEIGQLRKNQVYPRVSSYGENWHKVRFGDGYGYVYSKSTTPGSKSSIKNLNTKYTTQNVKIKPIKDVEVMDNSTGKLVPFGKLKKGIIYPIATDYGNWWRVIYLDRVGYVRKSEVEIFGVEKTKYDISLSEAVDIQMKANPQTDKEYDTFVSKSYIKNGKVTASTLNVRGGPSTSYWVVGQLKEGAKVTIINEVNGWYQIEFTNSRQWVNASPEDIEYYLNPNNFINDERQQFQFLDLARSSDATASTLNKFLLGKGILEGKGQAFIDASRVNGVNDIYLVSHALLETGNGTSTLANGVEYKGKIVYNMYGIGANDGCAITCGAAKAYKEGWTTPYKAIVGGAQFIGNEYIKSGQNTLYKMRWNPASMSKNGYASHQYATDIGWASKQIYTMYNLYKQLDSYTLYLDIPEYN
ncbi:SH3 domain-containing protein [Virgibacillus salarius]|uniref:SH3 domain-containing protein n=1 Tax=Virgibacillus salarius TaxID=447199 RepID=UPI001FECD120|nr:N-acetylglucosaminidase [Virgibacillus salarius]